MLALVQLAVEVSLIPEPIGLDLIGGTICVGTLSAVALFVLLLFS